MPADTRAALLDCALDLFAVRGYDAVGVQEIVERAGVTKPTLYHHFGSKRGLLDALLHTQFEPLMAHITEAAAYTGDLVNTLNAIVAAYVRFAEEHRAFYRLQLGMYFAPPDSESFQAVACYHELQYHIVEETFRQAVQHHGNMRGRQQRYAISFLGTLNTYLGLWLNGYVELNDSQWRVILHQFMHGIFS